MRNIINFDVRGQCICACVCNILDGSETIKFIFENDSYTTPQIEIVIDDTPTFFDLEVVGEFAIFDFDYLCFSTGDCAIFRFVDGEKTGAWFTIDKNENGIVPHNKTVKVDKITDTMFDISFVCTNPNVVEYSDDFVVSDDGELMLKSSTTTTELISIDVFTTTNDLVNKVTFNYEEKTTDDETGKEKIENVSVEYSIEYNANNDVIKFGTIGVNWVE